MPVDRTPEDCPFDSPLVDGDPNENENRTKKINKVTFMERTSSTGNG